MKAQEMIFENLIANSGFLDLPADETLDLKKAIHELKREKNAIILGHYYITPELQDISDFVGDSLGLSQNAAGTSSDIIVFLGVYFMAETAKILNPQKKVLIPDIKASCSLAESAPVEEFAKFKDKFSGHKVISYINCTAEIKALSDVICTSSNAVRIVESFGKDEKLIFAPDKNLGNYINSLTGRKMVLWDGACMVHEKYSLERILELKDQFPDAKFIAHPECEKPLLVIADFIGSTTALLKYTMNDNSSRYIVATESGILHQMRKFSPAKEFIPAPSTDASCACNDCTYMKLNTLQKLYFTLKFEKPEISLDKDLMDRARKPILRMLELS
ncbi:MAG TPA: quinolinate synthase NadA [Cyclobacteriaceae bacterium]|nr:quinolinate synthase NadA [Cyclobacteriaceae bacterium]